jgi:hypothetical protein
MRSQNQKMEVIFISVMYCQGAHWFIDGFIDDMLQDEGSSSSHSRFWQWQNDRDLEDKPDIQHFFAGRRPGLVTIEDTHMQDYPSNILLPNILKPMDYLIWQVPCHVCHMFECPEDSAMTDISARFGRRGPDPPAPNMSTQA